jgi:drug/metabolite transporter (DMT)-like permease
MAPVNAGVIAAVFSSALGGTAAALTRYTIHPSTRAILAIALYLHAKWPRGRDQLWVALLGALFFSLFFVIYNVAMSYTTAARGSLALSMLPLTTMLVAAELGREALSKSKTAGVLIAESDRGFAGGGSHHRRADRRGAAPRHRRGRCGNLAGC